MHVYLFTWWRQPIFLCVYYCVLTYLLYGSSFAYMHAFMVVYVMVLFLYLYVHMCGYAGIVCYIVSTTCAVGICCNIPTK